MHVGTDDVFMSYWILKFGTEFLHYGTEFLQCGTEFLQGDTESLNPAMCHKYCDSLLKSSSVAEM